jgi:predicted HTH domain antitoxin
MQFHTTCFFEKTNKKLIIMQIVVDIPDAVLQQAHLSPRELLVDFAVFLYQSERLSIGRASKLANLDVISFQKEMAIRNVYIHYDEKDYESDVETLKKLNLL